MTYTKLVKKVLPTERDKMSATELHILSVIENIIIQTIIADMTSNEYYKDIYKDCDQRLKQFVDIVYLDTICNLTGNAGKVLDIPA